MKSFLKLTLVAFLALGIGRAYAADAFIIADDEDFAPFCWQDPADGKIKGISYEIITEAFKIMGKPLSYTAQPWGRVTSTIQQDDYRGIDATVTIYTEKRKQFLIASKNPIVQTDYVLFTNVNNKRIKEMQTVKDITDLKSYKLISYLGAGWAQARFKPEEGYSIYFAPKLTNTLQILASGDRDFDIFAQGNVVAEYNIKNLGLKDKIVSVPGVSLGSETFNLVVHKNSPKLSWLKDFDAALETMKKNGKMKAIYDKYLK